MQVNLKLSLINTFPIRQTFMGYNQPHFLAEKSLQEKTFIQSSIQLAL